MTNKLKDEALSTIAKAYADLKGGRGILLAKYMAMVEDEMEGMRKEFGELLVNFFEDDKVKITVADMARAMGTSNRNTVYNYLADARDRKKNRFLDQFESATVFQWTGDDAPMRDHIRLGVEELRTGQKWQVWHTGPEDDVWYVSSEWTNDHYSTKLDTYKPDDDYPAHIQWYIDQKEEA